MLDFQYIRLSPSELKALRRLSADLQVYLSEFDERDAARLISLGFASLMQFDAPGGDGPQFLELENPGRDYLMYWSGVEDRRKVETRRFRINVFVSVLALLIAAISLLSDIGVVRMPQVKQPTPEATAIPAAHTSTPFCTDPTPTILPTGTPLPAVLPAGSLSPDPAFLFLPPESSLL